MPSHYFPLVDRTVFHLIKVCWTLTSISLWSLHTRWKHAWVPDQFIRTRLQGCEHLNSTARVVAGRCTRWRFVVEANADRLSTYSITHVETVV